MAKEKTYLGTLIFGQTGAGKGSIINILKGRPVGQSDNATHYTQHHRVMHRDGKKYTFWNSPDLNESIPVQSHDAVRNLQRFVDDFNIDLLIYCIQDELVDMTRVNYELVWRDICKAKIPIVLVVTGLKGKLDKDDWWYKNEEKIKQMKMTIDEHVCLPSWRDWDDKEYAESAEKLWSLVRAHFGPKHNVILFGESGCGKSSVVNMVVGKGVAEVSSSLKGCTFKNDAYEAIIGDKRYIIYDTAGLNEGEQGTVPHWEAIKELYTLIRELDGVSLLIFCMRGRFRGNSKANWDLFNKVICGGKVPTIAIVTGLENDGDMDGYLKDKKNSNVFKENRMEPRDIGCVVSIRGTNNEFADKYAKSQVKVRTLFTSHCLPKPWSEEKEKWFATIYSEVYEIGLCVNTRSRLDYSRQMREALDEFIRETGMKPGDTEKLLATLVMAERKFRGRF